MSAKSGLARRMAYDMAKDYVKAPSSEKRASLEGIVGKRYGNGLIAARKKFGPGGMPANQNQQKGPRGGHYHITKGGTKSYTPLASTKQKISSTPVNPIDILKKPTKEQVEKHKASLKEEHYSMGEKKAVKMFSFGYDDTIRAHQRGESHESLVGKQKDYLSKKGFEKDQRGDSPEEHVRKSKLAAQHLEGLFGKVPPASEMPHVYRGIVTDAATAKKIMASTEFSMRGMTSSTSWDPAVARSFVARNRDESNGQATHGIILKMKHKSGIGIEHISSVPVEKEVLMSGKAKFKVTNRYHDKNDPNYTILEGEEI